jgi:hypothetical protein
MVCIEPIGGGVHIRIKVVPNASRDEIVGIVGGRIKVRVKSPPEGGKANEAVQTLLANAIGVKKSAVSLLSGTTNPKKTFGVIGVSVESVLRKLSF